MAYDVETAAVFDALEKLRNQPGYRATHGLADDVIASFASSDPRLLTAVEAAVSCAAGIDAEFPEVLHMDEDGQVAWAQDGFLNFYAQDMVNPYVSAGAQGPWLVTLKGAVLYDAGGYGMLGWGHNPAFALEAMSQPQPMANIMTPNAAQRRLVEALRREIGHTRGRCPFDGFMCLNSGSEAMSLASRIADTLSASVTTLDGWYTGAEVKRVVIEGGFHGRTERPALLSNSSRAAYESKLASFRHEDSVIVIPPGDVAALRQAFADARENHWFIELVAMEPVMGEGNPGYAITKEFYDAARELTLEHGSLLLIDSVQAGLRTHGVLSVVDHPQLAGSEPPDIESYSKALNGGQYPLSVIALGPRAVDAYSVGTYGNTMAGNPRALATAVTVLNEMTDAARENIRAMGARLTDKLGALSSEFPGVVLGAQGTGLLVSCEITGHKIYGTDSLEEWLRKHGLGVIHGGKRSLRFTPAFDITEAEVDLIVDLLRSALAHGVGRAAA
ncbi:MAG TPA: aminotransferase class III-fold pyridoxal phosphate-dependent enzyme [Marmoricola sp.]|nr:aminotransferase class III-fold pyridoxal phosphate-dependent enzyme [Marmoricola sp.]